MSRIPNSSDQLKLLVTLLHHERGELASGQLSFGSNLPTQVSFNLSSLCALVDGDQFELIKAVGDNGKIYTLCGCKCHRLRLYAEYLIESDIAEIEFDQIIVRYWEVSEWFLHGQNVQGEIGDELRWNHRPKPLSVRVSTPEKQFTLSSGYVGSAERSGEDLTIHEHIEFNFTTTGRQFSLEDVRGKSHELSCLLSILIAYPATVMNVEVGFKSGIFAKVHFQGYDRPKRYKSDSSFWTTLLVQQHCIEEKWQTIFDSYYDSKYRKVCWVRLAGMQRYDGFWEYKALGYISILDHYVKIRSTNFKKPVAKVAEEKLAVFRQKVTNSVPSLSATDIDTIERVADSVFGNTGQTFGDRYRLSMDQTDQDVVKIISISPQDFQFILKIRNAVAHGDDPALKSYDYPRVSDIVGKVEILLTYWAFLDFGLTTKDFIECLSKTHNSLKLSCTLDKVHLARLSRTAEFFLVTGEEFDKLIILKIRHSPCFLRGSNGELRFSEHYTKVYADWERTSFRESGDFQPDKIFDVDENSVSCSGHAYIESGDNRIEVFCMWIIKSEQ